MKWYSRTVSEHTVPTLEEIRAYTELDIWFALYRKGVLTLEQAMLCGLLDILQSKRDAEQKIAQYQAKYGELSE